MSFRTAVSPSPPLGLQDRNGRSRLLFLQLELRRLKLACGTMNFNNNNNVASSLKKVSICRWVGGGGSVGILRSLFFPFENVCSLIFVVSWVFQVCFWMPEKRPQEYSRGIWGWMMTGRNKGSQKVERPSHADERTSVSKTNVIWFGGSSHLSF